MRTHEDPTTDAIVLELAARWRDGDRAALDELLTVEAAWLCGLVAQKLRGVVRRLDSSEDIVQELKLRLLRAHPASSITNRMELRAYLATVVLNIIGDRRRAALAAKRSLDREVPMADLCLEDDNFAADQSGPATRADRRLVWRGVEAAFDRLDEDDRNVITWRLWDRLSFREIGVRLGATEDAARMRLRRSLGRLTAELERVQLEKRGSR